MYDIFLSYSSQDRQRVELLHSALVNEQFDVFWDQVVPPAVDWDTWIRSRLRDSRLAIVVWSRFSVGSKNVRHEARIAQEQAKLVSVLIDPLPAVDLPMGLYSEQAIDLSTWSGAADGEQFQKLNRWLQSALTPSWLKGALDARDQMLSDEREARRAAEAQARTLRDQLAKDARANIDLKATLDQANAEQERLRGQLAARPPQEAAESELRRALEEAQARSRALEEQSGTQTSSRARRLTAGVAAVVALLLCGSAYVANLTNSNSLREVRAELEAARLLLQSRTEELTGANEELRLTREKLQHRENELSANKEAPAAAETLASKWDPLESTCRHASLSIL